MFVKYTHVSFVIFFHLKSTRQSSENQSGVHRNNECLHINRKIISIVFYHCWLLKATAVVECL